ncbi:MAG TPA: DNA polymerase/3'-5' exonuclease PolX [Acidobacteriota bacterium]|jgi:DNA polymerase (family 10)|nr:DNA polymerase/3'-5' exonuclease PolX [Acidobacteriota bacterium]
MENREFSRIFSQIADILEIQNENIFRIRSYRNTAQVLESVAFNIYKTALENPDSIKELPGVGAATFSKILEICQTGSCAEHQRLLEMVPLSLLEMARLPSIGPKKVALFQQHGIASLDQLAEAARQQKLRHLRGIGEKTELRILKAIEERERDIGRFRLSNALETAELLADYLRNECRFDQLSLAGSLRRWKETVADIDILVGGEDAASIMERFVHFSGSDRVLLQGETKSSIVLASGIQADLRVLPRGSFGAALQYFTGSKEHNVVLRERAKGLGLKVSEYGVFRISDSSQVAGEDEQAVYQVLDLQFIPPELRENCGEIEAAAAGALPCLIEESDLRGDLHMHTRESDGKATVEEMAAAAQRLGYHYIAITDHSRSVAVANGLDEVRMLRQLEEIRNLEVKKSLPVHVFAGAEVDILANGSLDFSDAVLAQLDIVVASVHSRLNMSVEEMTQRICRALENPHVTILAHPTGRLVQRRQPYAVDLDAVFETARRHSVALELNAYPARLDLSDVHCRKAQRMGIPIVISSDSHHTNMLGYIRYGIHTARRGWLRAEDVLNTRPLEEFKAYLQARRH